MPSSGGTYTGHPFGPTAAPGYGRVAPSGGVPADGEDRAREAHSGCHAGRRGPGASGCFSAFFR